MIPLGRNREAEPGKLLGFIGVSAGFMQLFFNINPQKKKRKKTFQSFRSQIMIIITLIVIILFNFKTSSY